MLAAAVAGISLAVVDACLYAQDRTFDAGGDGVNWNSTANWSSDDIPSTLVRLVGWVLEWWI